MFGDDIEQALDREVYGPYDKAGTDGARLKSMTATLRDPAGKRIGLLCINIDVSAFESAVKVIADFIAPTEPRPERMFVHDWREHINLTIRAFLDKRRKALKALNKEERVALVAEIDRMGLFEARNSVPYVAELLGVSRATIYGLLTVARDNGKDVGRTTDGARMAG